ncbi:glycosyltransferase family 39 protein [uncultured Paludibaculum sp.]|uniref:glycosyltransferase family 39 protein n=1 Tax=uncultured Paludibaculum sp. TaxID=1765020 RepID=UPI002AAACCF8|nr:glycosyltransferase family 39 protein [uncultured Paludibaculum sp.]
MPKALCTAGVYLLIALSLCGVLPLWLDEILQLIDTRTGSTGQLLQVLPTHHPGGAPLGYLPQHFLLKVTGYSPFAARLPSAVFAAASVLVVALLAKQCCLRHWWLAAALFGACPIVLRYSAEGRMYSQALFLSALSSYLYLRLTREPRITTATAYCGCLVLTIYTQPYAASVAAAHLLWSVGQRRHRAFLLGCLSFLVALASFLPWLQFSSRVWTADLQSDAVHFSASWKTPLMLFRELAGSGYWGSGLLLFLCGLALARPSVLRHYGALLLLLIVIPICAALGADAVFDYFLAARQILWVLPAVAVLAAAGIEKSGRTGMTLAALLLTVDVVQAGRYFTAPHEDWAAAARQISSERACLQAIPASATRCYRFFQPSLDPCRADRPRLVLAVSPYARPQLVRSELRALAARGFVEESRLEAGKSLLIRLRRRRHP